LTVIATGKLFVVLPQVAEKCEQLLREEDESTFGISETTSGILVPLAYPFPHLGKVLAFVFVSFGAWYVGRELTPGQTAVMAATGTLSSFASPLITIPYLLDQYQLPQDLFALFVLPGFLTTRLADVVGVMHLMTLTLIVTQVLQKRLRIRWVSLIVATCALLVCLGVTGAASRWYLASTTPKYDLDERLLRIEIPSPHEDVFVYRSRDKITNRPPPQSSTLDRIKTDKVLRVGYHPDHLPYSFFNLQQQLVGLDVELMHRLAMRLQVRLEFIPYAYDTVIEQLEAGEIDLAVGGLILNPERLLRAGFTQPYQTATMAVVLPDHRRGEFDTWDDPHMPLDLQLGVIYEDLVVAARRNLPHIDIVQIDSIKSFFSKDLDNLDGLIIAAEEGPFGT
ncbi:unnamed protein product, partial [marine sediment metagenome]